MARILGKNRKPTDVRSAIKLRVESVQTPAPVQVPEGYLAAQLLPLLLGIVIGMVLMIVIDLVR